MTSAAAPPATERESLEIGARSAQAAASVKQKLEGANLKTLGICFAVGIVIWTLGFAIDLESLSENYCKSKQNYGKAWPLFAIFVATIVGIILQPLPMGAVALMGLGVAMITKTLSFAQAFQAMSSNVPWIIVLAFFFSRGFIKTGLGSRIAYMFVAKFGSTTLGLAYSMVAAEFLMSPAIPSVSARAGGIFMPLCKALCEACGSKAGDGTEKKMGSFLFQTCFQCSVISSSMFLTAMAANPVAQKVAIEVGESIGQDLNISWGTWAVAAFLPGIVNISIVPLVYYVLDPPEIKESPEAPRDAQNKLAEKGSLSTPEMIMGGSLFFTVILWMGGEALKVDAISAALVGLSVLLVTGVISWKDCLLENSAWDTLTWFGALIAMASSLKDFGFIGWVSNLVKTTMEGLGLSWQGAYLILLLFYFYSHYIFASGVAHILAMYGAFVKVAIDLGAPPMVTVMSFAFLSNIMACTTHFGIGSAPSFFGAGYAPVAVWWRNGFILSIISLTIWMTVGMFWWWILGYFDEPTQSHATIKSTIV
jgi:anion transporter